MFSECSLASITAEDFRPLVGTRFGVAAGPFASELIEVHALDGTAGPGLRSPFSLIFRGPLEPLLPQGIHRLEHGQLGTLDLFLVPIGPDQAGMRYEAVFG
ncbi:MAG: hypothetical protein JO243_12975 [Solirubrobacterales bacterium]|nr:hypothetical protein [Solirubrobacterales bacterium]